MPRLIDQQPITLPTGTYEFERNIDASGRLVVRLARYTTLTPQFWDSELTIVLVSIDLSYDHGQSWQVDWLPAFGGPGGLAVLGDKSTTPGIELPETVFNVEFPSNATRARLIATVSGGTLVSELTLERIDG